MKVTYVLAIVVATAFAGCNSSSNSTQQPGCILPQIAIAPTLFAMVYPLPGATSVPTNLGRVIMQTSNPFAQIGLSAGTASPAPLGVPAPVASPLPSPLATGLGPNAPMYQVPIPTLSSATVYSVIQTRTFGSPPCVNSSSATIGTFTTQ